MSVIVVDTDVASRILKRRLPAELESELDGHTLAMSFVTVGELTKWTLVRKWGPSRLSTLTTFMLRVGVLPYDLAVARKWGALLAAAQLRGRPRPQNDTWIAACCLVDDLPLATLNRKDFEDFATYDGLRLIG